MTRCVGCCLRFFLCVHVKKWSIILRVTLNICSFNIILFHYFLYFLQLCAEIGIVFNIFCWLCCYLCSTYIQPEVVYKKGNPIILSVNNLLSNREVINYLSINDLYTTSVIGGIHIYCIYLSKWINTCIYDHKTFYGMI